MSNYNHNNIIEACIPRKDALVDALHYAIIDAIENNKDGLTRAAVIGTLDIIKNDWITK